VAHQLTLDKAPGTDPPGSRSEAILPHRILHPFPAGCSSRHQPVPIPLSSGGRSAGSPADPAQASVTWLNGH
jgi:hypothetical protein